MRDEKVKRAAEIIMDNLKECVEKTAEELVHFDITAEEVYHAWIIAPFAFTHRLFEAVDRKIKSRVK